MIRLNDAQHRRVKKLTRCHCANNVRGCCLLLDDGEPCVCVQAISYSLLCRYFREAVLPADRELCADLAATADTRKKCELCGKPFPARSNRAKYCDRCAPYAARRNAAERSAASGQRRGVSRFKGLQKPWRQAVFQTRFWSMQGIPMETAKSGFESVTERIFTEIKERFSNAASIGSVAYNSRKSAVRHRPGGVACLG